MLRTHNDLDLIDLQQQGHEPRWGQAVMPWMVFSCRWVGASQCNPEYEPGDMNKAVKWTIAGAICKCNGIG